MRVLRRCNPIILKKLISLQAERQVLRTLVVYFRGAIRRAWHLVTVSVRAANVGY
jgi:hypothetical protein